MSGNNDEEILFIGKITASITHEIKNVLASIKELNGLMQDLVSMSDDFPLKEKFQNVLPRILLQVERGAELTKNFNAFSHIPDHDIDTVDLGAAAEHLVFLSRRFARQKNIELRVSETNTSVKIETRPLQLYMGLFYVLEFLMNRMKINGVILLGSEKHDDELKINMVCEGEIINREELLKELQSSEDWAAAQGIIKSLGGSAEFNESNNSIAVLLHSKVYSESS